MDVKNLDFTGNHRAIQDVDDHDVVYFRSQTPKKCSKSKKSSDSSSMSLSETFFEQNNIQMALGEIGQECYPFDGKCNSDKSGWQNCCSELVITNTDSGD